ncbi:AAA family ATPase [Sessilibacter corallicola]|uniref:AAA family ATPase n=1 Tax=Sessilibacter corallicola TaxID=2904075 RepID=UPI001E3CFD4F|nr:MoxR family ATPase [Sessilibacter corallicola]MCE2029535.1 MoxR family ATPase [Sessilibacter corallicola]
MDINLAKDKLNNIKNALNTVLIGQENVVDQVLIALLANGHILIEGVPGLGKTLLVRALSGCFAGDFKRIQFTPDLMPSDITGHVMYDNEANKFRMRSGPVFTNLLLADEINRAPAKTQSALLEVMQERQVTIEGHAKDLPHPFMVLATQNPIDQEGTYPLPEAQLDRFLMKVFIEYPSLENEIALSKTVTSGTLSDDTFLKSDPIVTPDELLELQKMASNIVIDDQVTEYAVKLVRATRENSSIQHGAGPRASIALLRAAKAKAVINGNDFVTPDDVKAIAYPVIRHRISISAEMEINGLTHDQVLLQVFNQVEAPRV